LSTPWVYLGHTEPANTYWYLHAAPELLALAADRLDAHWATVSQSTVTP
jgi:hypothetical protein